MCTWGCTWESTCGGREEEKVWSNGEWFCNLHSVHHDNRQQNVPLSMCMSTNTIFVILPRCMLMAAPNTSRTWNHRPLTLWTQQVYKHPSFTSHECGWRIYMYTPALLLSPYHAKNQRQTTLRGKSLLTLYWVAGASLSDPHTSVTALEEIVCMFGAIYRKFWMCILKYFMKIGSHAICPARCRVGEGLLPERSVGVIQGSPRNEDDSS